MLRVHPEQPVHDLPRDETLPLYEEDDPDEFLLLSTPDGSHSVTPPNRGLCHAGLQTFDQIHGFHMEHRKNQHYDRQFCHIPNAHTGPNPHSGGYLPGIALSAEGNLAVCCAGKLTYYNEKALHDGTVCWQKCPKQMATTMRAVCFSNDGKVACGGYDGSVITYDNNGNEVLRREDVCSGEVRALAISVQDVLCVAGYDGAIAMFKDEFCFPPIKRAHKGIAILHAVFSSDGSKLATSGADGSIMVRGQTFAPDPTYWEDVWCNPDAHRGCKVWSMIFLNKQHLVSGGDDGAIVFFKSYGDEDKFKRQDKVHHKDDHVFGVRALALSQDCSKLVSGGKNGEIALFALDQHHHPTFIKTIDTTVNHIGKNVSHVGAKRMSLVFAKSERLISASSNGSYCVHDMSDMSGTPVAGYQVQSDGVPVYAVVSLSNCKAIATGGQDGFIQFFDIYGKKLREPIQAHGGVPVTDLAFLGVAAHGAGRSHSNLDAPSTRIKSRLSTSKSDSNPRTASHSHRTTHCAENWRGYLASCGEDGTVKVFDMEAKRADLIWQDDSHAPKRLHAVALTGRIGDARVAFGGDRSTLYVVSGIGRGYQEYWRHSVDIEMKGADIEKKGEEDLVRPMRAVAFSADCRLACSCDDGCVRVFRCQEQKTHLYELLWYHQISKQGMGAFSLDFSPVNGHLAVGSFDGHIIVLGRHGEEVRNILGRHGKLRAVRFAKDGCMAVGGNDGSIKLYGKSGEEIWSADRIHRGFRVYSLTFIQGQSGQIASAGDDGSVNIFSPLRAQVGFSSDAYQTLADQEKEKSETLANREKDTRNCKIFAIALSKMGILASGGSSGLVVVENTKNSDMRYINDAHGSSRIRALAFHADPKHEDKDGHKKQFLASSGEDGSICIFDLFNIFAPPKDAKDGHVCTPKDGRVFTKDVLIHRYDNLYVSMDGAEARISPRLRGGRYALALAFFHHRLATGWWDGSIVIFRFQPTHESEEERFAVIARLNTNEYIPTDIQHIPSARVGAVVRLSFSNDGHHLAASISLGFLVVIVLDEKQGTPTGGWFHIDHSHGSSGLISLAFDPEVYFLVTGGFDGSVAVYGPSLPLPGEPGARHDHRKSNFEGMCICRSKSVNELVLKAHEPTAHYDEKVRDVAFTATGLIATAGASSVFLWKRPLQRIAMFPFDESVTALAVGLHGWRPWDVSIAVALKSGKIYRVKSFSPVVFPLSMCLKAVASLLSDKKKTKDLLTYHRGILAQPLPKERCSLIHYCMLYSMKYNCSRLGFENVHTLCALCIHYEIYGGLDSHVSCENRQSTNLLDVAVGFSAETRDTTIVELILAYASRLPEWSIDSTEWTNAILTCILKFPTHTLGITNFLNSRMREPKPQKEMGQSYREVLPSTAEASQVWCAMCVTKTDSASLSVSQLKSSIAPDGGDPIEMKVLLLPGLGECPTSQQPLLNVMPVLSEHILTSQALKALIMHKWNMFGFKANCQGLLLHGLETSAYTLLAVVTAQAAGKEKDLTLDEPLETLFRVCFAPLLGLWVLTTMMMYWSSLWKTTSDVVTNCFFMMLQVIGSICVIFQSMRSLWVVPLFGLTVVRWEVTTIVRAYQWDASSHSRTGPYPGDGRRKCNKIRFRWLGFHFSDPWNWLDLVLMFLTIFVPSVVCWSNAPPLKFVSLLYALMLFCLCCKTLYYLRALPHVGHFTRMVIETCSAIGWFLVVMLILLVAFASSWMILALAHPDAHHLQEEDTEMCEPDEDGNLACGSGAQMFGNVFAVFVASFFHMYRLVFVGDFAGDSFALADWSALDGDEGPKLETALPAWILFIAGTLFFLIVLLNLLIAIINDQYSLLRDKADVRFWRERAMISIEAEMFDQGQPRHSGLEKKWPEYPPMYLMMCSPCERPTRTTLDDNSIRKVVRELKCEGSSRHDTAEDGLQRRMDRLTHNLFSMQESIESLNKRMREPIDSRRVSKTSTEPSFSPRRDSKDLPPPTIGLQRLRSGSISPRLSRLSAADQYLERPSTADVAMRRNYERPVSRHGMDVRYGPPMGLTGTEPPLDKRSTFASDIFSDTSGSYATPTQRGRNASPTKTMPRLHRHGHMLSTIHTDVSEDREMGMSMTATGDGDSMKAVFRDNLVKFRCEMYNLGVPMGPLPGLASLTQEAISAGEFAQALNLPSNVAESVWSKMGTPASEKISRKALMTWFVDDNSCSAQAGTDAQLPPPLTIMPDVPEGEPPEILAFEDGVARPFGAAMVHVNDTPSSMSQADPGDPGAVFASSPISRTDRTPTPTSVLPTAPQGGEASPVAVAGLRRAARDGQPTSKAVASPTDASAAPIGQADSRIDPELEHVQSSASILDIS